MAESESEVTQSCPTLCDPWTVAHQAPPSMGFSRQESWSGLPFPSPMAESKAELKSLLRRVKEESERAGLRLNIKKLRSWHLASLMHGK